jgi:hypothetical protein
MLCRAQGVVPAHHTFDTFLVQGAGAASRSWLRAKVSGCLRTLTGAEDFTAIRSYLATAAKHGIGFLHALTELIQGRPWLPA